MSKEEAKHGLKKLPVETKENTDVLSVGQLLLEFFEFYGFTFENEKLAIDIRHSEKPTGISLVPQPAPFRAREDFIAEAKSEMHSLGEPDTTMVSQVLFHSHQS